MRSVAPSPLHLVPQARRQRVESKLSNEMVMKRVDGTASLEEIPHVAWEAYDVTRLGHAVPPTQSAVRDGHVVAADH